MAVRITKDHINIRAKLAELERPIGVNGAALMATNTPQEAFSLIGAGRKNIIINGAFEIAQRGTSFTNIYNYTLDRWQATRYGGTVNIITQQNTGGISDDPGLIKCIRYEFNTGGAGAAILNQPIESSISKKYRGKWVTLSFWARTDSTHSGKQFSSTISYHTNTSYNDDGMFYSNFKNTGTAYNFYYYNPTTAWRRFQQSIYVPTNAEQLGIALIDKDYSNGYIEFAGVQLEEGKVATPFEHRSINEELALCQRYYQQIGKTSSTNDFFASGFVDGTSFYGGGFLKRTMRTAPAISYIGNIGDLNYTHPSASFTVNSIASYQSNPDSYAIRLTSATSGTTGYGSYARSITSNTALTFSAEL